MPLPTFCRRNNSPCSGRPLKPLLLLHDPTARARERGSTWCLHIRAAGLCSSCNMVETSSREPFCCSVFKYLVRHLYLHGPLVFLPRPTRSVHLPVWPTRSIPTVYLLLLYSLLYASSRYNPHRRWLFATPPCTNACKRLMSILSKVPSI